MNSRSPGSSAALAFLVTALGTVNTVDIFSGSFIAESSEVFWCCSDGIISH